MPAAISEVTSQGHFEAGDVAGVRGDIGQRGCEHRAEGALGAFDHEGQRVGGWGSRCRRHGEDRRLAVAGGELDGVDLAVGGEGRCPASSTLAENSPSPTSDSRQASSAPTVLAGWSSGRGGQTGRPGGIETSRCG